MATEGTMRSVFHIFWAWRDEREEAWLREMARAGWHLSRPGLLRYRFEQGEPSDTVYRLDYQHLGRPDRQEYLEIFRAAGWEHAGEVSNWHFFRTQGGHGASPEIFSDAESRAAKYRRLLGVLVVFLPLLVIGLENLGRRLGKGGHGAVEGLLAVGAALYAALLLLLAYAVIRIAQRMRAIERGRKGERASARRG